jgi:hypothetical protein
MNWLPAADFIIPAASGFHIIIAHACKQNISLAGG